MVFPTYKLGCDRHYIPMVSLINSTSCRPTLSSTCPWHTADRIDFLFSCYLLMILVSSAQLPALFTNLLVLCPETKTCLEAAAQATTLAAAKQADQADQQQQTKQQTRQQTKQQQRQQNSSRKLQKAAKLHHWTLFPNNTQGWVLTGCI